MPNFNYITGVPDAANNPSDDQPDMKINNDSNELIWQVDHFGFKDNNGGKHKFTHLVNQVSNPTVAAGEAVLFTKLKNNITEMFYRYGSAPQAVFQLTRNGAVAAANNGRTSLIGPEANPMKMMWGFVDGTHTGKFNGGDTGSVVFTSPFDTVCYTVTTQPFYATTSPSSTAGMATVAIDFNTVSTTGFTWTFITNSGAYSKFIWVAIGA